MDCGPGAHNDLPLIGWGASGEPTLGRDFHVDMADDTGVPAPSHLHWFDKWFYIRGLCTDLGGNWLELRPFKSLIGLAGCWSEMCCRKWEERTASRRETDRVECRRSGKYTKELSSRVQFEGKQTEILWGSRITYMVYMFFVCLFYRTIHVFSWFLFLFLMQLSRCPIC